MPKVLISAQKEQICRSGTAGYREVTVVVGVPTECD